MPLKQIDIELIKNCDCVFFAGGGLFGLSYLGFFEYVDKVTELADEYDIPVVFSSLGINNMDAISENEVALMEILERRCIKAISVRENVEFFREYSRGCDYEIRVVCDPAVWAKHVYNIKDESISETIGINVVRGGLFKDNKKEWTLADELEYLYKLKCLLDNSGLKYQFFTNGSFLDDNALRYFAKVRSIPENQVTYSHTTRQVVETISTFKSVIALRMHSSIVAYSFGIPSVALSWNPKIPHFYRNINHPERALEFADWDSVTVYNELKSIAFCKENQEQDLEYVDYLMSLYSYLYDVVSKLFLGNENSNRAYAYNFSEIRERLAELSSSIQEDELDMLIKISKAENHYLARFVELKRKADEMSALHKELNRTKAELNRLNRTLVIRLYKFTKHIVKKVIERSKHILKLSN